MREKKLKIKRSFFVEIHRGGKIGRNVKIAKSTINLKQNLTSKQQLI